MVRPEPSSAFVFWLYFGRALVGPDLCRRLVEDGIAREVPEETGVTVWAEQLTGVYKNIRLGVVTLAFRCSAVGGGQEQATGEAERIRWLTVEEATRTCPRPEPSESPMRRAGAAGVSRCARDGTHLP